MNTSSNTRRTVINDIYCGNNPITRIDSKGENWITDGINAAWNSTKWAFNTAVNYINEEQKADQRAFWHVGSLLLLHFYATI